MSLPAVSMSALVAVLSLNMTARLVAGGVVYSTATVTDATATTPIVLTLSAPHGYTRPAHGIVSGVVGVPAANGLFVLTPTTPTTISLSMYDAQGVLFPIAGTGAYANGGSVQVAFPDGSFLLGRRNIALATATAAPRVVFVPTMGKEWVVATYGGVGQVPTVPPTQGNAETQFQKLARNIGTRYTTFDVYITGCANPPDPDAGDFDALMFLTEMFYSVLFDSVTPFGGHLLREMWPSQLPPNHPLATGLVTQRGQQWMGTIEFAQPLTDTPLQFVPVGTYASFDVTTVPGGSSDDVTFTVS